MVRAAVPIWWIAVARENHLCLELSGANNGRVEVIDLEPQEHAVPRREVGVADPAVIVLHIPAMQLKDQLTMRVEALIGRAPVPALTAQQSLIPATARLNITHTDKGLGVHKDWGT
jgi:hypothetical protein